MARLDGVQRPHLTVVPDSPEELRAFLEGLGVGAGRCGPEERRRRPRRAAAVGYQIRIGLDDVAPPVWRRFVVRSDLMLDELHTVVQTVMGWTDSHLHTWVSGDAMYAENAEQYEMRESIEDGFSDEDEEVCEEDVRLDEVLVEPGDRLIYAYDFGDNWEHTLVLESIADGVADPICLAGERCCPPEDCGGSSGYEDLLKVLADPTDPEHDHLRAWAGPGFSPESFDLDAVNGELRRRALLRAHAPAPGSALAALLTQIPEPWAPQLYSLLPRADLRGAVELTDEVAAHSTAHLAWLLRRIGADGITLTSAGYLPPGVVAAARDELHWAMPWIGNSTREIDNHQIRTLRAVAQQLGLTRKYRGKLLRTKLGSSVVDDPQRLLRQVTTRIPFGKEHFERDAGLLLLVTVAAGTSVTERDSAMTEAMAALGWRTGGGAEFNAYQAMSTARPTLHFLYLIGAVVDRWREDGSAVGPQWARALARAALR